MTSVKIKVDYDVSRWLMIPPKGWMSWRRWATRNSKIWARETGREENLNWAELLDTMLLTAAKASNAEGWDVRMVHMLTPTGGAPDPALLNLIMTVAEVSPEQAAQVLIEPHDPLLVRPPDVQTITLPGGALATAILRYTNEPNGMMLSLYIIWRANELVDLVWTTSSFEIARVLAMYDDAIRLAAVTTLVPAPEDGDS